MLFILYTEIIHMMIRYTSIYKLLVKLLHIDPLQFQNDVIHTSSR